ncbi:hypothetical protein ACLMJK_004337 [Lecanora helva]
MADLERSNPPIKLPTDRPRLYSIVETYMRNHLHKGGHPAFKALENHREAVIKPPQIPPPERTSLGKYSKSEELIVDDDDQFSFEDLYKDAEGEKQRFKDAITEYEKTAQSSKYMVGIKTDSAHTWEEVLTDVDIAAETYNSLLGFWGKIRKSFRNLGKTNKVFEAWASLLPSESEYFSVLCGGLKLILGAAARLQALRDEICDALLEIPLLLTTTNRALGAFRKSKSLHEASADLYVATLVALNHIVVWYKGKVMKRIFKSFLKQNLYEQSLSEKVQAIKSCSQRFEIYAQLCSYETVAHTDQALTSHRREWREITEQEAGNTQQAIGAMSERIKSLEAIVTKFFSSNERIDCRTEDAREPLLPLRKAASEAKLREVRHRAREAALYVLDYEDEVLARDMEAKLRMVWTLPRSEQNRILAIMHSPQLRQWMTTPHSSALFVNGNYQGPKWQQPTAFISAKLLDSFPPHSSDLRFDNSPIIHLAFFCGDHPHRKDSRDPDCCLDGMMRNLIAQLLLSYPEFDIETLQNLRDLRYNDIDQLCNAFAALIEQLPSSFTVFCVLDGVSYYEDSRVACEEAGCVLQALVDIAERTTGGGLAFKLLLMSPWASRILYRNMINQDTDVLWTPVIVPQFGEFTVPAWNALVGSHLAVR